MYTFNDLAKGNFWKWKRYGDHENFLFNPSQVDDLKINS